MSALESEIVALGLEMKIVMIRGAVTIKERPGLQPGLSFISPACYKPYPALPTRQL